MSGVVPDQVAKLLTQSLAAWRLPGEVCREADGALRLNAGGKSLRVERAPADLLFRWLMTEGARTRGATGIPGLLRTVRAAIDPGWRPVRLRVAPLPVLPP